ncbi:hypothetical protein DFS33DRAFT_1380554 [Desarmillaria ectypa]|nr:hypothetical protein DFS33DRAFT_1380554 [Desarmillaria ectypa]
MASWTPAANDTKNSKIQREEWTCLGIYNITFVEAEVGYFKSSIPTLVFTYDDRTYHPAQIFELLIRGRRSLSPPQQKMPRRSPHIYRLLEMAGLLVSERCVWHDELETQGLKTSVCGNLGGESRSAGGGCYVTLVHTHSIYKEYSRQPRLDVWRLGIGTEGRSAARTYLRTTTWILPNPVSFIDLAAGKGFILIDAPERETDYCE